MKITFAPKRFLTSLLVLIFVGVALNSLTYSGGPPTSLTNAPGEANCTQCHGGTIDTTSSALNDFTLSGNFSGNGYIPDSTYNLTLKYVQSGKSKWGFQITCLTSANGPAGTFTKTSNRTDKATGTIYGATRQYMEHSSSGNSGSDSIEWTFQWTAPSSNVDTVIFFAVINVANGNGGTSGDIIRGKQFRIGPSSLLPTAIATVDTNVICSNSSVQYFANSSDTNSTYSWVFPFGSPSSSTDRNPVVSYAFGGVRYGILTATNSYGVSAPDTATLTVKQNATAFISGSDRTICEGDSVQLIASFDPTQSYVWNDGTTGNTIWAKDSGDYQVTVTKNGCVRTSNVINVSYRTKPTATLSSDAASNNDTACTNSMITLNASSGFDTYYFYGYGNVLDTVSMNTYTTEFTNTGTFGVRVQNTGGCPSDLITYDVVEKERIDSPSLVCDNITPSSVEFSWTSPFVHQGYEISLDGGQNWTSPSSGSTGNSHSVTGLQPEQSVELWVRGLTDAPCNTTEISRAVCAADTCNKIDFSITATDRVCFGNLAEVEINGLSNYSYALDFENNGPFKDTVFSFQPTSTREYQLLITDSGQLVCADDTAYISITVDKMPEIGLMADQPNAIYCPGSSASFTANDSIETYQWIYNEASVQSGTASQYDRSLVEAGDSLYVIVEYGVCVDTSEVLKINEFNTPNANFSYSRFGPNYTFTPEDNSHSSYLWDFGDGSQSTDVSPVHDFSTSEASAIDVTLTVESTDGCESDSTQELNVPDFTSIEQLNALGIKVYPNPVEQFISIENSASNTIVSLSDLQGKELMQWKLVNGVNTFDLGSLESGVYQIEFVIDGKVLNHKIMKY